MKTNRRSFVAACLAFLGLGRLAPNKEGSILRTARQTGKTSSVLLLNYDARQRAYLATLLADSGPLPADSVHGRSDQCDCATCRRLNRIATGWLPASPCV